MSEEQLTLQVGGTLNPRKHIYIQRPEDAQLLSLLMQGQFCNVLSPRQMGKSSLMARTVYCLRDAGVGTVSVDLAGDLGSPGDPQDWYLDLASKIARDLNLGLDLENWWSTQPAKTTSQRLMRFFGEELPRRIGSPLVVFLDEIDSTLRLPYADDLFFSIRTLNNDRALVPSYENITFCLLGVATPNELIKRQEATAYNVGQTLELRDFDEERDDLALLRQYLSPEERTGRSLLRRVLYWTGGHPYLTTKLCKQLVEAGATDAAGVDEFTHSMLSDWERLGSDVHFQQVERFIGTRVSDKSLTLRLYEKIRARELDYGTQAHIELRLSGLVKRGEDGTLVVRNRIYDRIFDLDWAEKNMPVEAEPKPKEDLAQKSSREVRRAVLQPFLLSSSMIIALIMSSLYVVNLIRIRELSAPGSASIQLLSPPGARRSADSESTIVVPAGTESVLVALEVEEEPSLKSYKVELRSDGGKIIWRGENFKLGADGTILINFSRSFLPAGNYQVFLYGTYASGREQRVATYSMPIVYASSSP